MWWASVASDSLARWRKITHFPENRPSETSHFSAFALASAGCSQLMSCTTGRVGWRVLGVKIHCTTLGITSCPSSRTWDSRAAAASSVMLTPFALASRA